MKRSIHAFTVSMLLAGTTLAQPMPDMAAMQRAMEEAQRCMAEVDMDAVERLGEEARVFESELQALCAEGKRNDAQRKALAFSLRMLNDPDTQKMRECSEMMREVMQGMPMMPMPPSVEMPTPEEIEQNHICDEMN